MPQHAVTMGPVVSDMALYAVVAMGFRRGTEAILFIVLTVPTAFGSRVWGRLAYRIGPKRRLSLAMLIAFFILRGVPDRRGKRLPAS